jgi:signal transduction histidine kinase/ActR/RegA family two-component response regulator
MPAAPLPPNETDRLAELQRFKILDTAREEQFDDLTYLAKQICNTPVSLISLVDKDRQWFKSCFGLDAQQTPREQAFCAYTILSSEPFVVTDAINDPRVNDNPLVLYPPKIRFYVGFPLTTQRGYSLGSLCVIDFVPRSLTTEQMEALRVLTKQVVLLIESRLYQEQLAEYARSLEEVSQSKSRFIATMSHEIRTPLNGLLGSLQLLADSALGPIQMEYFKIAQTCSKSVLAVINDILDLSKIEAGKVELIPQPTNLYSLANEVKTILNPSLLQNDLNLIINYDRQIPEYLNFDPDRMRQILLNLTANAIKFSPKGAVVKIEFTLKENKDNLALIECRIIDQGIGMSEEEQKRVFIPFAQASANISKTYGGTGLGLSITNELLRLMGSHLSISSEKGQGSTFFFLLSLPIAEKEEEKRQQIYSIIQPEKHRDFNILIAEDNPVNQLVISRALERKGHRVTITANGQEALEKYKEQTFDIVILDLEMPVMGGEETARQMRQFNPDIPILALSAHALSDVQKQVLEIMDGYLAKPIDFNQLELTIQKLKSIRN